MEGRWSHSSHASSRRGPPSCPTTQTLSPLSPVLPTALTVSHFEPVPEEPSRPGQGLLLEDLCILQGCPCVVTGGHGIRACDRTTLSPACRMPHGQNAGHTLPSPQNGQAPLTKHLCGLTAFQNLPQVLATHSFYGRCRPATMAEGGTSLSFKP